MSAIRRSASSVAIDQQPQTSGCSPPECTNTARSESSNGNSDGSFIAAPPIHAIATLRSTEPSRKTRMRCVVMTSCLGTATSPVGVVLPSSPGCSHQSSTSKGGRTRSSDRPLRNGFLRLEIALTRGSSGARNLSSPLIDRAPSSSRADPTPKFRLALCDAKRTAALRVFRALLGHELGQLASRLDGADSGRLQGQTMRRERRDSNPRPPA